MSDIVELSMNKNTLNDLLLKAVVGFLLVLMIITTIFALVANYFSEQLNLKEIEPIALFNITIAVFVAWNFFAVEIGLWKLSMVFSLIAAYVIMQLMDYWGRLA